MHGENIQYVAGDRGSPVAVIIPISLWQEIQSESKTDYLYRAGINSP